MPPVLITFVISLLIGAVAFFLVFSWPPEKSRTWFLWFVGVLVFVPAFFLIFGFVIQAASTRRQNMGIFSGIYYLFTVAYPLLVSLLLFIFVAVKGYTSTSNEPTFSKLVDPRQWDLQLENQDLLSLMRRREWSFLIDFFLPLIPFLIAGSIASVFGDHQETIFETCATSLSFSLIAGPIYWLFKDSLGGRSIGKRLTDLHTVHALDGRPITPGQSLFRNWVFLIPLFPLVELAVASIRKDNLRLGDLMAKTFVVQGPPNYVDGEMVLDPRHVRNKMREKEPVDPFAD